MKRAYVIRGAHATTYLLKVSPVREFFLKDGAGFCNPSFTELCNFLRKRRVIHKRPNPGSVKFWQKMGREIAVLSYPTY